MKQKVQKLLSIIVIVMVVFSQMGVVLAFDVPTPPSVPSAPENNSTPPEAPTAPSAPTAEQAQSEAHDQEQQEDSEDSDEEQDQDQDSESTQSSSSENSDTNGSQSGNQSGNESNDGQTGSSSVDTGDATNNAGIITVGNSNLSAGVSSGDSASVTNSGNGSDSQNNGSATIVDNTNTTQNNSASVVNDLTQTTTTGQNSASQNVGDASITTGDANTTGTVITAVNTNVDGLAVAEFNIEDNHIGDIVLDFASGCISGCGGSLTAANTGNGSGSTNNADLTSISNDTTFQTNEADVENNLLLASNSGDNTASQNTGGDSEISTGDANVAANILTAANNNIVGNVIYTVVNIFGDLIGDIIMPDDYASTLPCSTCVGDLTAANSGNGSDSQNSAGITQVTNNDTFQFNEADIENNLLLSASTGHNDVSENTGGNSSVETGDTNIDAQVLNVANSNIDGGNWFLVLVNEAGNWIGRILGAPDGADFAGSEGTEFVVNENGEITAVNSGNGSGSDNNASVTSIDNSTTVQNNTANIVNNVNLSANTGGNAASQNTGGNSNIKTGDANVVANIVNFVNNNIVGSGRLYVTVVNVFGSWLGNFVGPGEEKEEVVAQGGPSGSGDQNSNVQQNGGSSTGSGNSPQVVNTQNNQNTNPLSQKLNAGNKADVYISKSDEGGVASIQVAGFKDGDTLGTLTGADKVKNSIKINLAWLLLLLPSAAVVLVVRKKLLLRKSHI